MMVLSASSIEALQETGDPFYWFVKQSMSAAIGVPLMWICSRLPHRFFRWPGYPLMALSIIGLVLVLFVGASQLGAQRWIYIGPLHRPAVRAGQARAGAVGRRPAGPQGARPAASSGGSC